MSRPYQREKAPNWSLAIRRTCTNLVGHRAREDHIRDRDWGCSRILYFQTHQNLGSTFWGIEKPLLLTRVCAIFVDQMASALVTHFTRSERIHRLIMQVASLTTYSRSGRGTHIEACCWFIDSVPSRSRVVWKSNFRQSISERFGYRKEIFS
jgi:hypothetical protein